MSERVQESPAETECISKSLSECKEVKHAVSGFDFFIYIFFNQLAGPLANAWVSG